jgi:hypothetical protein
VRRFPNHSSSGSVSLYRAWKFSICLTAEILRRERPPFPAKRSFADLLRTYQYTVREQGMRNH